MATTVGMEEDLVVQAARILLTLRSRKLVRWPEWVPKEPVAFVVEKHETRPRSGGRRRGDWRAGLALPKLEPAGTSSSDVERECSPVPPPPRCRERLSSRDEQPAAARQPDSPPVYFSNVAGSGPSTSADRKPRTRHSVDKAASVSASTTGKEPMKAPSPETPLDFGAGSGASSSWDDLARPPAKRRAPGSGGGASSSDEGCSSPDKRVRVDAGDGEKAISEPKMSRDDSDKLVKFEFDLNMPPEDEGLC